MNKKNSKILFILIASLLITGLCVLGAILVFGSGLAFWFSNSQQSSLELTPRSLDIVQLPTPTPTNTPAPTLAPTSTHTPTPTESPTPTHTATPVPAPTDTPVPTPTNTPTSPPPPPTPIPLPTDTPAPPPPDFPFVIEETAKYDTNHLNFDVYVAITNADNNPLSNYRIIGTHSSGLQLESQASAGDWTQNSGAMHYKAGNIKYEVFNSPSGAWTLQLVDSDGNRVAEPVEFPFDAGSPTWYFLLFKRQ